MAQELSDLQKAALDLMIEYKKVNGAYTEGVTERNIIDTCALFDAVGGCSAPTATATVTLAQQALAEITGGGAATSGAATGIPGGSGSGISLGQLLALRHQNRDGS